MKEIRQFITPNDEDVFAESDSRSIQNAVALAVRTDCRKVVIPRMNARTGKARWDIDESILLPSNITIVLDNCHLRLVDGAVCSFFRNERIFTPLACTIEGEQENIVITGIGKAVLDGGVSNGLTELNSCKEGNPHVFLNHSIFFLNVKNFVIENLTLANHRYWGMRFEFCRFGRISNIFLDVDAYTRNQDGINLRDGCNNILIENISGTSGDDMIALSAIDAGYKNRPWIDKWPLLVHGRDHDIHSILIRNVRGAASNHPLLAIRNHDGAKIYDVTAENLTDTEFFGDVKYGKWNRYALVRIGNNFYYSERASVMGETSRITLRNLHARYSTRAIIVAATLCDSHFEDIHGSGVCRSILASNTDNFAGTDGAKIKNVTLTNCSLTAEEGVPCPAYVGVEERKPNGIPSAILDFSPQREEDYIENLTVENAVGTGLDHVAILRKRYDVKFRNCAGAAEFSADLTDADDSSSLQFIE